MSELKAKEIDRLVQIATSARDQAYAPYSHFYVGASLLMEDGEIIAGCNIENASYSLSICAERVAASAAIVAGYRKWRAVSVATIGAVTPCGACRQFLAEFGTDVPVIMVDVINGNRRIKKLSQLLPDAFDAANLPIQQ